ncbi:MAG: hypothetical protein JNL40_17355 [Cyclobacteriaceae bacterium]|nr:hypothetical protein [Cyclobacteriaceae bacterium]
MDILSRLLHTRFIIKIRNWEYWPFGIIHAPLFIYWLWLSLKARSFTFFSASNPGILMGGMFGESKYEVMEKVPASVKPKTLRMEVPTTPEKVLGEITRQGLIFPVIFKPDLGERGWRVKKISCAEDIAPYLKLINMPFLVQEYVSLPLEFGVFYVRYPSEPCGRVVSIVGKEMLSVNGDGHSPLSRLILQNDRAKLQWEVLADGYRHRLDEVLPVGERLELVSIGNHCLGTKFLNANHLINDKLSASFDVISRQIDGFYFGRFDLRTASIADLEEGRVMVMELNGCGAEPAHIYDPGFSLLKAIRVLFRHWHDIYRVSYENHLRGTPYISFREARSIYQRFKTLTAS